MRKILLSLSLLLLFSCSNNKIKFKKTEFYYLINSEFRLNRDTVRYDDFRQIGVSDSLISKDYFVINKKDHVIKMYTSDFHAPVDGGRLYYTLDTFGTIYSKSTTWPSFIELESNNDSINKLINTALGYILLKPKLHCYQFSAYLK
jgi:hypothetical protein